MSSSRKQISEIKGERMIEGSGGWGFVVPVILSIIVGTSAKKSLNNVDETFSIVFSFVCFLVIY